MSETTVVFFHIASSGYGGGSHMLYRLLSSIDRKSITPILLSQKEDKLTRKIENEGIPVHIVPFQGSLDTYNQGLLNGAIHRKIRSAFRLLQFNIESRDALRQADVIWCKNLRAVLTIAPYALHSDARVWWNIGLGHHSKGVIKYLNSIGIWIVDKVLIESEIQAKRIFNQKQSNHINNKLEIINKGIDVDNFAPDSKNNDNLLIGIASLITPRKRVVDFIEAAALIHDKRPDVRFRIAGTPQDEADEKYMSRLKRLVKSNSLEEVIEFVGWVDEMPEFLNDMDVFVLPSLNEGIPGVIKEAMATETPVVASNVGGVPKIVKDETTGYLVDSKSPSQIAEHVLELCNNPELREEMGANGRQRIVEEYSIETYIDQYEEILNEA